MGLKRRKNKNNQKFDPRRAIKLDHKRKCYVVEEAPRFPLIATPRQLQKRFHYFSESESDSEELNSDDDLNLEWLYMSVPSQTESQTESEDLIRMISNSSDSGFEGGGTAPADPKKMLGKKNRKYTMTVQKRADREKQGMRTQIKKN